MEYHTFQNEQNFFILIWWITESNGYHAYFAGGYGGQFIYVVPDLDLVVAITCNISQHREDARFLINSHVVPAIEAWPAKIDNSANSNTKLFIYPNPAKRAIYFINNGPAIREIQIYTVTGSLRGTYIYSPVAFLNGYENGVYIAVITLENGHVQREKIIVSAQ